MPLGEGWWLNTRTDESVPIVEHWEAVKADPSRFGVAHLDPQMLETDRDGTLLEVLKKGWVRVRSWKGDVVYETWKLTRRVADGIALHLETTVQPGPYSSIRVNVASTGRTFHLRMADLYADLEAHIEGLAGLDESYHLQARVEHLGNAIYLLGRMAGA